MKVYILDDEILSVQNLIHIIESYFSGVSIVGYSSDVHVAYDEILQLKPDLLFLDVRLKGEIGFRFLEKFTNRTFEVIIITAYDEYALESYKNFAIGYLQKPINIRMFQKIIEQADIIIKHKKGEQDKEERKLLISNKNSKTIVYFDNIIYLQAETNYTHFILKEGKTLMASKHLKEYELLLPKDIFYRVHSGYIVNLNYIKEYRASRVPELLMINGEVIHVAARRKKQFLKYYTKAEDESD